MGAHVDLLESSSEGFQSRYHMSHGTFQRLVGLLRHRIAVDEKQSRRCTGGVPPITPELVVAAGLKYLGGSFHEDISDALGMHSKSAETCVDKFMDAVDATLRFHCPVDADELRQCADEWDEVSGGFGLYYGAIGCLDGWLCCTNKPSVRNALDYRSGHYQRYGLNIQAMCDANLRFLYFGVVAPGKTNDLRAFNRCLELRQWLQSLPEEYFIIGDNAYQLSNKVLIPFSGSEKHQTYKRTYNFYLSQLRIRIEMAFGRLTTKWRIFRRQLDCSIEKNSQICRVAAKLHNFVIDNDTVRFPPAAEDNESFGVEALLMDDGTEEARRGFLRNPPRRSDIDPYAEPSRRSQIVDQLTTRDARRPEHNLIRNRELDEETVYGTED